MTWLFSAMRLRMRRTVVGGFAGVGCAVGGGERRGGGPVDLRFSGGDGVKGRGAEWLGLVLWALRGKGVAYEGLWRWLRLLGGRGNGPGAEYAGLAL